MAASKTKSAKRVRKPAKSKSFRFVLHDAIDLLEDSKIAIEAATSAIFVQMQASLYRRLFRELNMDFGDSIGSYLWGFTQAHLRGRTGNDN